jgi:hypothetical protein
MAIHGSSTTILSRNHKYYPYWAHIGFSFDYADNAAITTEITDAINSWKAKIPNFNIYKFSSGGDVDIIQTSGGCGGGAGCHIVTSGSGYYLGDDKQIIFAILRLLFQQD